MDERRKFQRVPFTTEAEMSYKGNSYHGELLDISLQGALLRGKDPIPLEAGTHCELAIHLLDSEITLYFEAEIVHCRDNRFGFKFLSEDTETATHLRRLLELNIGSAETIDREVAFWVKEK